jgi:type II secretory pathway component PulK
VSRRGERGAVLLAAVGALAALTAVALGFASTATVDRQLAWNAVAAAQADALLRSAVAAAGAVLADVAVTGAPDTARAAWLRPTGRQPLGAGWVAARVEDEARRLDLNAAALRPALPRLLAALDLDPALADAIADWIDADDATRPHGAERDWYLAHTPRLLPRDGPLGAVGELARVRGVDAAVLARLGPHVTTAGETAVNPNTASREVLVAVLGDGAAVERVLAARTREPLDERALGALLPDLPAGAGALLTARSQRYGVRAVAAVGALRRGVDAQLWAPAGTEPAIVAWQPFAPADRDSVLDTAHAPTLQAAP